MARQNLTTARFVLQCLLQEIEAFDRCIPVARDIQVGDVADALSAFLADRRILRLTVPNAPSANRRPRRRGPSPRSDNRASRAWDDGPSPGARPEASHRFLGFLAEIRNGVA